MKYLAIEPFEGECLPLQAFQHAQNHFSFVKEKESLTCYVAPYVITTDGKDIMYHQSSNGSIDIGFQFLVPKPNTVKNKTPEEFSLIIESEVERNFHEIFSRILTREGTECVNPDEPIGSLIEIDKKFINVHSTNCGLYNLTKRKFCPIYFVVLPNDRIISFETAQDTPKYYTTDFRVLLAYLNKTNMTFLAKSIIQTIQSGDILFPIVSKPKDM
ncbi:MAG: hypothetical protein ACXADW_02810 [Candidatus Hodarchaeales archaeon]|jgi:hypothetical protein